MGSTIISEATLSTMPAGWWPTNGGFISFDNYSDYTLDYEAMYRRHNNVKICVDFLARNMAHPGLHVYKRDKDNDRIRLREHAAVRILSRPLPSDNKISQYKLFESVLSDMFISGNGYLLKIRDNNHEISGLLRIPYMLVRVDGVLKPNLYRINLGSKEIEADPGDIVHFRTYNPHNNSYGISPLEGLREILAEEHENSKYSSKFWQNAARIGGVIERPVEAKGWSDAARANFRAQWESLYSGQDNAGKTAVLEEGMQFKPISWAPKDTLYIESRKLTREECARAYHIPPPMVGILERSTFNNIESQNKSLYTDVLGPLFRSVQDDIDAQYLTEFPDLQGAYVEFNIEAKLQGDFEKQTASLRQAVGVPYMTANEARAIMNMSRIDSPEADQLVTPLNMSTPATYYEPNDGKAWEQEALETKRLNFPTVRPDFPEITEQAVKDWTDLVSKTLTRQRDAVLPLVKGAKDVALWWDEQRWNREVAADFFALSKSTAGAYARAFASQLAFAYNPVWMEEFLRTNSRIAAENLNKITYEQLAKVMGEEDPLEAVKKIFAVLLASGLLRFVNFRVHELENFAEFDVADKSGLIKTKTWVTRSGNPRDTHAALNGVTVGIRDTFPNGAMWPGDYRAGAGEVAYCQCSLVYGRDKE